MSDESRDRRSEQTAESASELLEALKFSQELLATTQRIGRVGNWGWDIVTKELTWSDEIYRIFGLSRVEFDESYDTFIACVHPEDRRLVKESVDAALYRKAPYHSDHRIVLPSGDIRFVHEHAEVTFAQDGRPLRMIGTVQDITDIKLAEEAVRLRERLLNTVLDALPVGVWLIDQAGHITRANPAAIRIWGGARYVGLERYREYKGWWPGSGKRVEANEWSAARAVTKGETVLNEVIEIEAFDGSRKTITNSAVPLLDQTGKIQGAIVVVEDTTDRMRFQKALEYSNQLLQESRTELRNLSGHIDQRIEEERKQIVRELHDQLGQSLIAAKMTLYSLVHRLTGDEELRAAIGQAVDLIDESVQSIKRLALGLRPFVLDHLGLAAAIDSQIAKFQEATGITCICSLPGEDPCILNSTTALTVFRILEEALTNTARHAQATQVGIKLERVADWLVLEIHDNGKGIPPARMLAPDSLGLSGMRERASRIGGDVRIESGSSGTSVIVRIPVPVSAVH